LVPSFYEYTAQNMPLILAGLAFTCKLFVVVIVIALPLSTLVAILAATGPKWVKDIIKFYTSMFRGSPLLLQLYLAYFGLPFIGIILPTNLVIVSVFVLCISAYESEVIRGGIISIEKGQYEACQVLGMSKAQTMWRVVIPQTVRKVLPQTCSQVIVLFKDTSLVAAIGVGDLLRSAQQLVISDMRIDSFAVVLVLYLAVSSIMVIAFSKLEKKYSFYI
jgi:polar amino acid transport system permease protein